MKPILLDEVASTNGWLAGQAANLRDGQWVRARAQSAGRGRQGRAWAMLPGNLAASVLVKLAPGEPPASQLGFVAAVALHEVASAHVQPVRLMLKWPNDLLLDGAKLSGILCERSDDNVVVGFGVNLAAAPAIEGRDTIALPPPAPDPDRFLEELATGFAHRLGRWRAQGFGPVREAWLQVAHPIGTPLRLSGDPDRTGLFAGLGEDGALLLQTDSGTRAVHAGDLALGALVRETA